MNSSKWGPCGWDFLFHVAAGYDLNETPKSTRDKQYQEFFRSIGNVLPCRYCRESYGPFFNSLDIEKYLRLPSCGMIRFVYDMKQLVGKKLKDQEVKALQEEFYKLSQQTSIDDPRLWEAMRDKAHSICFTKPTPTFEDVVNGLLKHRASCSAKMKTCRTPLNVQYPNITDINLDDPNKSGRTDKDVYAGGMNRRASGKERRRKRSYGTLAEALQRAL